MIEAFSKRNKKYIHCIIYSTRNHTIEKRQKSASVFQLGELPELSDLTELEEIEELEEFTELSELET